MRKQTLLLALALFIAQTPSEAFDFKGFKKRHEAGIGTTRAAMTGRRVGMFVGMPWLGAGVGAAVGGMKNFMHKRRTAHDTAGTTQQ